MRRERVVLVCAQDGVGGEEKREGKMQGCVQEANVT